MKRALAAVALSAFVSAAAAQSGNNLEIIHHPNYDKAVFMPFSPAIKVKSGKILWLAGGTALPVYHGRASAIVNSYFAPFNHKPTTTNMAVLELGEPEQLVEIQVVAVVDN